MQPKQSADLDKIDHVAEQLDDIKITVDELADSFEETGRVVHHQTGKAHSLRAEARRPAAAEAGL